MDNILYRPSWQKLRVSTLKEYNLYGGFLTTNGTTDGLARFNNYIEDADPISPAEYAVTEAVRMGTSLTAEYYSRVYRVWNHLTSVLNGLHNQPLEHLKKIDDYSYYLRTKLNQTYVVSMSDSWDWDVVRDEMTFMWISERVWFTRIDEDMTQRIIEKDETAPDLLIFKKILDDINNI